MSSGHCKGLSLQVWPVFAQQEDLNLGNMQIRRLIGQGLANAFQIALKNVFFFEGELGLQLFENLIADFTIELDAFA